MPTPAATVADGAPARPLVAPAGRTGLAWPALCAALVALALAARLPAYRVNENYLGDAVSRTELAARWAAAPHWIGSFADGACQFGPLHLYVVGAALKLGVPAERAGPLTSLVFGTLTVLPLAALTRRLFGTAAAAWSGVALAFWGLHIQMSTTGASEALSLFLVLSALALFDPGHPGRLAASGLVLTAAGAVRYDTWLLIPLLALVVLLHGADRRAALGRAAVFGLCALVFPAVWMAGNARAMGDPLYPMHTVEDFHREWVPELVRSRGELRQRLQGLLYWPAVAAVSLGPLACAAGFAGMAWAFRARREVRWLLWCAWAPAAYFTFRSAALMDFQPMARFTVAQVALVLPFLKPGTDRLLRRVPGRLARAAVGLGAASVVAVTAWLAAYTWQGGDGPAGWLQPLSPLSRNPLAVRRLVELFRAQRVEPWEAVVLDADPRKYWDVQIAFSLHHPEERIIHVRWGDAAARLEWFKPTWVVRFDGGPLESSPLVELRGPALSLQGRWFDEVPGALPPLHLYRARP